MPAPARPTPHQIFSRSISVPDGIVGVYTDLEVDALLVGISGGGTVDLSAYATTDYVDTTKADLVAALTTALQERYTKHESDGLFVKKDDLVAPPSLDGYATEQYVTDAIAGIPLPNLSDVVRTSGLVAAIAPLALKSDVDAALAAKASLNDADQDIVAANVRLGVLTMVPTIGGSKYDLGDVMLVDMGAGYRLALSVSGGRPEQYATLQDLTAYATTASTTDLIDSVSRRVEANTEYLASINNDLRDIFRDLDAVEKPGPWVPLTLDPRFEPTGGKTPMMRLLPGGNVQVIGEIVRATAELFEVDKYTNVSVPVAPEYRPAVTMSWTCPTYGGNPSGAIANVLMSPSGVLQVNPKVTSPGKIELSGIYAAGPYPTAS